MLLCRYFNSDRCLDIIKNQRLSATDPTTFNDPFEMYPGIIGKPDKDKTLRYLYDLLPRLSSATKVALPDFNGEFVSRDNDAILKKVEQNMKPQAIRRIDFGCKCESEKVIPLLKDDDNAYQHVKLYKALVHEHRYSLSYKEIDL